MSRLAFTLHTPEQRTKVARVVAELPKFSRIEIKGPARTQKQNAKLWPSLALALEAMRQLERHGGGTMLERAYEGFASLPAPKRWFEILEVPIDAPLAELEKAYRRLARIAHPDNGGSNAAMAELNKARDDGRVASATICAQS